MKTIPSLTKHTTPLTALIVATAAAVSLSLAGGAFAQDVAIATGDYAGRIGGTTPHATSGYISLKAGRLGAFTAKIQYAGFSYSLKGTLGTENPVPATTVVAGVTPQLEVTANYDSVLGQVNGTVRQLTQNTPVPFTLNLNPYTRLNPCPIAGSYTLALQQFQSAGPMEGGMESPRFGYASVTVSPKGQVKTVGGVPDTTKFTSATFAYDNNPLDMFPPTIPVYAGLHKVRGSLNGDLMIEQFGPTAPVTVFGSLNWHRPQQANGPTEPPMETYLMASGAPYVIPVGVPILEPAPTAPNVRLEFFDGALTPPVVPGPWLQLTGNLGSAPASGPYVMSLAGTPGTPASLKFNARNGLYTGVFTHPATGKPAKITGVVVQYSLGYDDGTASYIKGPGFGPGNFLGTVVDPVTKKKTLVPGSVILEPNTIALPN